MDIISTAGNIPHYVKTNTGHLDMLAEVAILANTLPAPHAPLKSYPIISKIRPISSKRTKDKFRFVVGKEKLLESTITPIITKSDKEVEHEMQDINNSVLKVRELFLSDDKSHIPQNLETCKYLVCRQRRYR